MTNSLGDAPATVHPIRTVLGEIPSQQLGVLDAHNHAWIEPVPGAHPTAPVLNDFDAIQEELCRFRAAGGSGLLDCQPPGCGRNARRLAQLSAASGVHIITCTGFHRARYYQPDYPLFSMSSTEIAGLFLRELTVSVSETEHMASPIRAGFIKVALEQRWNECALNAIEAAAAVARETRDSIEIHTEKGALAEKAVLYFEAQGVKPQQLVLCHMDKRADSSLHAQLAKHGVLLEYDTFYRPRYNPEANLWPLIVKMVDLGLSEHVALATDMATTGLYQAPGNGPGLASLPGQIRSRLQNLGSPQTSIRQMLGANIASRLAGCKQNHVEA